MTIPISIRRAGGLPLPALSHLTATGEVMAQGVPTGKKRRLVVPEGLTPDKHALHTCSDCGASEMNVLMDKEPPHPVVALLCAGCGTCYWPEQGWEPQSIGNA